jgi:hypothetical protein
MDWLAWAPLGAATLHIFEEFVIQAGFQLGTGATELIPLDLEGTL